LGVLINFLWNESKVLKNIYFIEFYNKSTGQVVASSQNLIYVIENEDVYAAPFYYESVTSPGQYSTAVFYFSSTNYSSYKAYIQGGPVSEVTFYPGDAIYPIVYLFNQINGSVQEIASINSEMLFNSDYDIRLESSEIIYYLFAQPSYALFVSLYWKDINENRYGFFDLINPNNIVFSGLTSTNPPTETTSTTTTSTTKTSTTTTSTTGNTNTPTGTTGSTQNNQTNTTSDTASKGTSNNSTTYSNDTLSLSNTITMGSTTTSSTQVITTSNTNNPPSSSTSSNTKTTTTIRTSAANTVVDTTESSSASYLSTNILFIIIIVNSNIFF